MLERRDIYPVDDTLLTVFLPYFLIEHNTRKLFRKLQHGPREVTKSRYETAPIEANSVRVHQHGFSPMNDGGTSRVDFAKPWQSCRYDSIVRMKAGGIFQ